MITEHSEGFNGRNVYATVHQQPKFFWLETGETVASFNALLEFIRPNLEGGENPEKTGGAGLPAGLLDDRPPSDDFGLALKVPRWRKE
jgi:hypothetical protein